MPPSLKASVKQSDKVSNRKRTLYTKLRICKKLVARLGSVDELSLSLLSQEARRKRVDF